MRAAGLNALYAEYLADPGSGLEPLLSAVRDLALRCIDDEDAAQRFVIEVWRGLPIKSTSFSAWIRTRLCWRNKDHQRNTARDADRQQQPPELFDTGDDGGEPLSDEEALDVLQFRWHQSTGQLAVSVEAERPTPDLSRIDDPLIRKAAELIAQGRSQADVAEVLGVNRSTLYSKLRRFRLRMQVSPKPRVVGNRKHS